MLRFLQPTFKPFLVGLPVLSGQIRCVEVADQPAVPNATKHERAAMRHRRCRVAHLERHDRESGRCCDSLVLRHQIQPRLRQARSIGEYPEYSGDRSAPENFVGLSGWNECRDIVSERCIHSRDVERIERVHEVRHRCPHRRLGIRRRRATRVSRAARADQ
jgi:hypothetical protein